jgi:hypothetical protein
VIYTTQTFRKKQSHHKTLTPLLSFFHNRLPPLLFPLSTILDTCAHFHHLHVERQQHDIWCSVTFSQAYKGSDKGGKEALSLGEFKLAMKETSIGEDASDEDDETSRLTSLYPNLIYASSDQMMSYDTFWHSTHMMIEAGDLSVPELSGMEIMECAALMEKK